MSLSVRDGVCIACGAALAVMVLSSIGILQWALNVGRTSACTCAVQVQEPNFLGKSVSALTTVHHAEPVSTIAPLNSAKCPKIPTAPPCPTTSAARCASAVPTPVRLAVGVLAVDRAHSRLAEIVLRAGGPESFVVV